MLSFNVAVVYVIVILLVYIIAMPIIAFIKDKLDYKALKYELYDVSDDLVRQLASRKNLPIEVVLYKKKLYHRLLQVKQISFIQLYFIFTS